MAANYLKRTDLPRGIRNNNPGNLRKTNIGWQGEVKPGTDPGFEQFENMVYGLRALMIDVIGDMREGKNTLRKLINEFAPASENNTTAYVQSVSKYLGIGPDVVLNESETLIKKLIRGIVMVENGKAHTYVTDADINAAFRLVKKKMNIKAATIGTTGLLLVMLGAWLILK